MKYFIDFRKQKYGYFIDYSQGKIPTSVFLVFSGGTEKDQWLEMG